MKLLKYILFFAALLLLGSINSIGQQVTWSGSTTQFSGQKGGTGADSMMLIPVDTTYRGSAWTPVSLRMYGRIAVKDGGFYYHNGTKWLSPTSSGGVDSATVNALISDSLSVVRDSLNNRVHKMDYYGDLYNQQGWVQADSGVDFIVTSATQTVQVNGTTGNIDFSGGNNSFVSNITAFNPSSILYKQRGDGYFIIGEKSPTSYGFGLRMYQVIAYFNMTSGAGSGKLSINVNASQKVITDSAISFSVGDTIKLSLERIGQTWIAYVQNVTTDGFVNTIRWDVTGTDAGLATMRISRITVMNLGGLFSLNQMHTYSRDLINTPCAFLGTSITSGAYSQFMQQGGFAQLMQKYFGYANIMGGSGARMTNFATILPQLPRIMPEQVVLEIGTNDFTAIDSNEFKSRYDSIVTVIRTTTNARVLHLITYSTNSSSSYGVPNWMVNFQRRTYGDSVTLFEPYYRMQAQGYPAAAGAPYTYLYDGLHPNNFGHQVIAEEIIKSGKLWNVSYEFEDSVTIYPNNTVYFGGANLSNISTPPLLGLNLSRLTDKRVIYVPDSAGTIALLSNIPSVSGYVPTSRTITATSPIQIDGTTSADLSANRTISVLSAGAAQAGVVTTGSQTLAGQKTFPATPIFSTMTAGSLLYAGTSGILSQNNSNLFWNNTTTSLGIGTSSPNIDGWTKAITLSSTTGNVGFEAVNTAALTDGANIFSFRAKSTANCAQMAFDQMGTGGNTGRIRFDVWNAGVINNAMRITPTGKVLIGTTSDSIGKLNVTGVIRGTDTIRSGTVMQEAGITSSVLSTNASGVHQATTLSGLTFSGSTLSYDPTLTITTTSSASVTVAVNTNYNFNGTNSTFTMPVISGNTGKQVLVMHVGSGTITVNSNAGGNELFTNVATNTLAMTTGDAHLFINTGTYWKLVY